MIILYKAHSVYILVRLMDSDLERKARCTERGETYGPEVDDALRVIAESPDYICAERLTPHLVWMATHLATHGEMVTSPSLLDQLSAISVSTVRRRLRALARPPDSRKEAGIPVTLSFGRTIRSR